MGRGDVGGQAVIEGVMMRGIKGQATAVRTPSKKIEISFKKVTPITKRYKYLNIPFLRGIFILIDSLKTGIDTLNYSASFFEDETEEESKLEKWVSEKLGDKSSNFFVAITMLVSFGLSIGLFLAIPTLIASLFKGLNLNSISLNLIEAIIRIIILIIYMVLISKMDDIYRVYQYHGAEHKTIFCYEAEEELTIENVKKFSRFHPRCGTNFLFLTMFVSILIFSFTGWGGFLRRIGLRIILVPLVSGISYEIIRWLGKHNNKLSRVIAYPGLKLQELTTREPDDDQIEVAIAALMKSEGLDIRKTIGNLLDLGNKILKEENIECYKLDTQLLLSKVLEKDKIYLITNRVEKVEVEKEKEFLDLIEKRKNKMPVKYILGETEFMGLDFFVEEGVLIPRGDTEVLVEEVLKGIEEEAELEICDLCSGSGAIGISIASYRKNVKADEIDYFDIPEKITKKNIEKNKLTDRVKFIKSDLLKEVIKLNKKYDIIVSNPPYIKNEEINTLMEDVKYYEPHTALDGGEDGLVFYRRIVSESKKVLKEGGILAFEIGYDQGEEVPKIMIENGYLNVKVVKNLAGLNRVVIGNLL
ncbi:peptide chain release factor N(5)-glutamine methyltransferase [Clostridium sp.]|uniref:peptide chain release factor N(5)-glutamine methyltransferase n=1 Tax=Clostridium sp. TaxID=1506 RepID=UPI00260528EC|nr:peptide chain release factor N(5)-glutamine methyltransferase [Clostridium sp.]